MLLFVNSLLHFLKIDPRDRGNVGQFGKTLEGSAL